MQPASLPPGTGPGQALRQVWSLPFAYTVATSMSCSLPQAVPPIRLYPSFYGLRTRRPLPRPKLRVYAPRRARSTGSAAHTQQKNGLGRIGVRVYQLRAHHGEHALAFAWPSTDSVLPTVPHYCLQGHAPISFPLPSCDPYTVSSLHRCVLAPAPPSSPRAPYSLLPPPARQSFLSDPFYSTTIPTSPRDVR